MRLTGTMETAQAFAGMLQLFLFRPRVCAYDTKNASQKNKVNCKT